LITQLKDAIIIVDEHTYKVKSQSGNGEYRFIAIEIG